MQEFQWLKGSQKVIIFNTLKFEILYLLRFLERIEPQLIIEGSLDGFSKEPHSHRYNIVTFSGLHNRLIPTKTLDVLEQALWSNIIISSSTTEIALGEAARELNK